MIRIFCSWAFAFMVFIFPAFGQSAWVDSLIQTLTVQQKVGQLFMVPAYTNKDAKHHTSILRLVKDYHIGGIIFMAGFPVTQANHANLYQRVARVPLLVSQDAEWGLSMRLKGTVKYPKNMTLGAIRHDSMLYEYGAELARQLRTTGVHMNFAPVLDINNNPRNPVINYRSFGENKFNVARKGLMFTRGLQDHQVIACAKHFPGHGDTETDSHFDLPIIPHTRERLDTLELYPFSKSIQSGIGAFMVAHLFIPSLDSTPNRAVTLSPLVVNDLLRNDLGFNGLIFTDALEMSGVSKYFPPGKAEIAAFKAGNDIMLTSANVQKAAVILEGAVTRGEVSMEELNKKVRRILLAKQKLGLEKYRFVPLENVTEKLHSPEALILKKRLYESAITLVKNEKGLIPFRNLENLNIAYIQIGGESQSALGKTLKKYGAVKTFSLPRNFSLADQNNLIKNLKPYNRVIVSLFGTHYQASRNFGVPSNINPFTRAIQAKGKKVVLTVFGSPYQLKNFGTEDAILIGYEEEDEALVATGSAIFGGIKIDGRLPVTASDQFPEGTGLVVNTPIRFGFGIPEEQGIDHNALDEIDSIANHYIGRNAMPGCAILVAKGNQVIYEKGFGKMTRSRNSQQIDPYSHTYDLASVTKVCVTTLSTIKLVEQRILDLDKPIQHYLPELKGTNKAKLTIRRLLQHNAGLPRWKPFYRETYADERHTRLNPKFYQTSPSSTYNVSIGPGLFSTPALQDTIWDWIKRLEVLDSKRVNYSDIGMIILGRIIENVTGMTLEQYTAQAFYRPLGMNSTYFNPALKGLENRCPPAGEDTYWRKGTLKGYVHDEASAILGGQAGHAGLFSNVYDLAKLMFMLKSLGVYGGNQYFLPTTLPAYTRQQLSHNRKGLGFDKPENVRKDPGPASQFSSSDTYGHTGFTGTCIWIDPHYDLMYIFLSNRTYPKASNKLLLRENVRTLIMDQIYEAMFRYRRKHLSITIKQP